MVETWLMRRWLVVGAAITAVMWSTAAAEATAPAPPDTVATSENVFIPQDEELTECVGALPPPNCGTESKGGWRQALVLGAIAAGVALIMWRVIRATRRRTS